MRPIIILLAIALLGVTFIIVGCTAAKTYGEAVIGQRVSIKDILTDSKSYDGKTVVVEGRIIQECPTGCWFNLKDETGVLYVDLNPAGLAIPQKVNHSAKVKGRVAAKKNQVMIIGEGVQTK